jgi:hypothetical protein
MNEYAMVEWYSQGKPEQKGYKTSHSAVVSITNSKCVELKYL